MKLDQIPQAAYLRVSPKRKWPVITLKYSSGKQKSITIRADKKTAEEVLTNIRRQITLGIFKPDDYFKNTAQNLSLDVFIEKYIKHRASSVLLGNISKKTLEMDGYSFKVLLRTLPEIKTLQQLTKYDVNGFAVRLVLEKYAHKSVNDYIKHLRAAFC